MKYNAYRFALLVQRMLRAQEHLFRRRKNAAKCQQAISLEQQADSACEDLPKKDQLRIEFLKCRKLQKGYWIYPKPDRLREARDQERRLASLVEDVITIAEMPRSLFADVESEGGDK